MGTSAENIVDRSLPWFMGKDEINVRLSSVDDPQLRCLLENFLRDGFVVVPDSINHEICDSALLEFRAIEERNRHLFDPHVDSNGHYPRIINLHLVMPTLRRLFYDNKISISVQDFLFQSETVLYTSLFYERGSAQDLHRDTPYFCTRPEYRYFGMWVALEDVDPENGPLMVMKGGHLIPELEREAIATEIFGSPDAVQPMSEESWNTYQAKVVELGLKAGLPVEIVPVAKGSTIIWHPQLPHGGAPIQNLERTRFSLVMHTTPINTPVYHQDAFFNPSRYYPTEASWPYFEEAGRKFACHNSVGFNHQVHHGADEFM